MDFLNWHDPSSTEDTMSRNTRTTYGLINSVADLFNDLIDDNSCLYQWNYKPHLSSKVEKTNDGYKAQVEVPGYNKENLSINVENKDLLVVRSTKKEDEKSVLYRLQLDKDTDQKKIKAKTEHGVLFLTLPNGTEHQSKCIKIE
jgi:HSP20 family molecular chaperone IbpA